VDANVSWIDQLLAGRPITARDTVRSEDGAISIRIPKFDGKFLGRYLQPRLKQPFFHLKLDELGAFVWEHCDGSLTGDEIVAAMQERFPDAVNVRDRVALFLRLLVGQKHVELRAP
jgi:hypothetical protein